jgi:tetratricopeptide (TPR) repeat protein
MNVARPRTLTAGAAALALAAGAVLLAPAAQAQSRPAATVNPRLSGALSRLARDPRDVSALLDAGQAALEMNDVDAAIGFYQRADAVIPGNAQVKAGLAGAYVRRIDPLTALPLFDEAARAGVLQPAHLADRGLAYDLVGDTVSAQRYYRQALAAAPSDDLARRLALSQAIDGDRTGMEATLSPLLQRQDRAAWRTRAFALAILGKAEEAESIARSTMSPDLALAMAAYLRYMPRLTRAQQAAAGNLGFFPRAADIGRDDPRIARYTRNTPELAAANTSLTPAGKPFGRKPKDDKKAQAARAAELPALAATPPPEVRPTRETVVPPATTVALAPAPKPAAPPPAPRVAVVTLPPPASQPTFSLPPAAQPPATLPSSAPPTAAQPPAKPITLADAFADLASPSVVAAPAPGAVDVTKVALAPAVPAKPKIDPAALKAKADADKKAKAEVAAKTKAEADKKAKLLADKKEQEAAARKLKDNPARTWVQVAAGRDRKALAFDWRRLAKADSAVFKGKSPYVMAWGQTNRLMTGPFASSKAASAFIAELKKAGVFGAFPVSTDAGEVVDTLPAG